jgi:hypothetical protein
MIASMSFPRQSTTHINQLFQYVEQGDYAAISHLLNAKKVSSGTVHNGNGNRPSLLIECCRRADRKLLQLIIQVEKDQVQTTYEDVHGHRALWYAIETNFIDGCCDLFERKLIDPNLYDTKTSLTPLFQAIEKKRDEVKDIDATVDDDVLPRFSWSLN